MYTEDQLLPISALQHLLFCERQCALIHIEGLWAENRLTVEGRHLHERTHDERRGESRPGVRITRGLNLCSYMLGLVGKADLVEIERVEGPGLRVESWARDQRQGARGEIQQEQSSRLSTLNSQLLRVVPVEYKRGRPKKDGSDRVQLCAQSLCLEEMLGVEIAEGFLYYGRRRRRTGVAIDQALRDQTLTAITRLHEMIQSRQTPRAQYEKKCDRCSLKDLCLPQALRPRATAARYLARAVAGEVGAVLEEVES
ncbi:MAG: CRISPR-associated protein Cas4 [Pirellulales bacterium]